MTRSGRGRLLVFCLAGCLAASSAAAETDRSAIEQRRGIRMFNLSITLPPPSWEEEGVDDRPDGRRFATQTTIPVNKSPKNATDLIIWFQDDEDGRNWSRIYTLRTERLRESEMQMVDQVVYSRFRTYFSIICGPENFFIDQWPGDAEKRTFIVYCESTVELDDRRGYGPDVGEIALIRIFTANDIVGSVWHRWRGARFVRSDRESWPMERRELDLILRRFEGIRIEVLR